MVQQIRLCLACGLLTAMLMGTTPVGAVSPSHTWESQTSVLVGLPEMVRFNIVDGRPVPNERGRVEILDGELEEAADWWCRATIWLLRQKDLTALAHVPGAALTLRGTAPLQHRGFDFRAKPPTLQLHRHTGFRERVAARTLA